MYEPRSTGGGGDWDSLRVFHARSEETTVMERKYQGWEKFPVHGILHGDTVMLHPEDQMVYRAERTRQYLALIPVSGGVCEARLRFEAMAAIRLWVKVS